MTAYPRMSPGAKGARGDCGKIEGEDAYLLWR